MSDEEPTCTKCFAPLNEIGECPYCGDPSELSPAAGSTPKGVNHLACAQKAFEAWLRELDSTLQDSELAFDEYAGAIRQCNVDGAKRAIYRATQSLRVGRKMIKAGLDAGV